MYRFPDNSFTNATADLAAQSPMTRLMDTGMIPGLAKPAVEQVPQLAGHFGMMGDNPFTNATVGQAAESPMTRLMQSGMLANRRLPPQLNEAARPAVEMNMKGPGMLQDFASPAVMPPQTGQLGTTNEIQFLRRDFSPTTGQTKDMRMPQDFASPAVMHFSNSMGLPSQAQPTGMPQQAQAMGQMMAEPLAPPPSTPPSPMQNYAGNMGGFGQQLQGFVNPFGGIAGLGVPPGYNNAQSMGSGIGQLMGQGQPQPQGVM